MSYDFDDKPLYDPEIADMGVEYTVSRRGRDFLSATLRYVDAYTQKGELEYKRVRAQYAKKIRQKKLTEWQQAMVVLTHVNMTDWSGVTKDGKAVPFSPDAAMAFFEVETNKWIGYELLTFANDPDNYVSDEEFNEREIEKN